MAMTTSAQRTHTVTEFFVLVAAMAVLVFAVSELHMSPNRAEAAGPSLATTAPRPTADGSTARPWSITLTSPTDDGRRLLAVEPSRGGGPDVTIAIDSTIRHQRWLGTGGAFTDESVALLSRHDEAMSLLFDPNRPDGAALDLGRLPLSATDFSAAPWTWEWDEATGRATPPAEAREAVRLVDAAVEIGADLLVVGSPWTAPREMLTNDGDLAGGSTSSYANLLAAQVRWLIDNDVPLTALTLANEPGHVAEYPTVRLSNDQLIQIGNQVDVAVADTGVELWAVDHNWADRDRVDAVLAATDVFDAAAFHCYDGTPAQMAGLAVPAVVTECTGTTDNWISTFGWNSRVLIAESLRAGSTGLLAWNLALAPEVTPLPGGCPDCRGLLTIDPDTAVVAEGPEFYLLAHLSRVADRGAIRIETSEIDLLPTVAFANPDGSIGIFGHNDTGSERMISIVTDGQDTITFRVGPWELFSARS